ncbi:unnamed protein product [Heterobilharzia americana]|nr:unnamed protein product [Heterobilharzia americana]
MSLYRALQLLLLITEFCYDYLNFSTLLHRPIISSVICSDVQHIINVTNYRYSATSEVSENQTSQIIPDSSSEAPTNHSVGSTFNQTSRNLQLTDQVKQLNNFCNPVLLPPDNIAVSYITSDSFEVSWSAPSDNLDHLHVVFTYEILISSPQKLPPLVQYISEASVLKKRITNLSACSFYVVQMRTISAFLMKSSDWSNPIATTTSLPKHLVQSHFEIENVAAGIQKVGWSKLIIPGGCMASIHLLQINQRTHTQRTISLSINETEYVFYDLESSTQYTYQLKVISPFGNYLGNSISISTTSLPEGYSQNTSIHPPEFIEVFNVTSNSLMLSWSPLKDIENKSHITSYEIFLSNSNQKSSLLIECISSELTVRKIENLTACNLYTIQLRSVIDSTTLVYSEWSKPMSVFTLIPEISERNLLQVTNIGRYTQRVMWSQLTNTFLIDECKAYLELILFNHVSQVQKAVKLSLNETSYLFDNLEPITNYTYRINLISPFGNINDICLQAHAETLPEGPNAPTNLSVTQISPNQLTLKWTNPTQHPAFNVTCYRVYKRESLDVMGTFDEYQVCNGSSEFRVTALIPGRQYVLYMQSEDSVYGLHSNASETIAAFTYPSGPNAPTNLSLTQISPNQLTLKWTNPTQHPAFNVTCYRVYKRESLDVMGTFDEYQVCNGSSEFRVTALIPGRQYVLYMQSEDSVYGLHSNASETIAAFTYPSGPNAPTNLSVTQISPNQLTLKWTNPTQHPAFNVTCYRVYKRESLDVMGTFDEYQVCNGSSEFRVTALIPGRQYVLYMQSEDSVYGLHSNASETIAAFTYPSGPNAPTNLSVTQISPNQLTLKWTNPTQHPAFNVTCYRVYKRESLDVMGTFDEYQVCNGSSEFRVTALIPGRQYVLYMQSEDSVYGLHSNASETIAAFTYPSGPNAPTNLSVTQISPNQLTLKWTNPTQHPAFNVTCYRVYKRESLDVMGTFDEYQVCNGSSEFRVTALIPGRQYVLYMQSEDSVYGLHSNASETIAAFTYPSGPNAPTNLSVTQISPNQLTLKWTNPTQHPAFNVTCYRVYKRESLDVMGTFDEYQVCNGSSEFRVTALIPGRQYVLYMQSEDSVYGLHSNASETIAAFTYPSGPNAPTNLSVTQISPNQLTLKWTNPTQHPAFNVTCYRVYKRESLDVMGTFDEYQVCNGSSEFRVTALIPGRQYVLYMQSEDSVYGLHSNASETIAAFTYPSGPKPPINLSAVNINPNWFSLKWTISEQDSAFVINNYLVYIYLNCDTNNIYKEFIVASNQLNMCNITSLIPGTNYTVYMKSIDSSYGIYSNASYPITVITYPSRPNPPTNVSVTGVKSTQFHITWTESEQNLAFIVNCYLIYIHSTIGVLDQFQKFNICYNNEFDIKSLNPGINYSVYIESIDLVYGIRSLPSESIMITTYPEKPFPPENVTITDIKPNQLTLTWSVPEQDTAFMNICYLIFSRPLFNINDDFIQFKECSGRSEFTMTSLIPGINYTVYMKSVDCVYGKHSDATKLLLVRTNPYHLKPPVNLTVSNVNAYGFTVNWNRSLQNSTFGNESYYVFIKSMHNYTQKPMKYEAGLLATQLVVDNLYPDTWYNLYVECSDMIHQISSTKSIEISVHTYPEAIERDSINQISNMMLNSPSSKTNHIKQDSMIILYLPLSQLNNHIPKVCIVSLVLRPTKDKDDIYCSEGCTKRIQYNNTSEISLIEPAYNNRDTNENASWEILVHSPLTFENTRVRRSADQMSTNHQPYSDEYFVIGENSPCQYNSHNCNGPLKPATQYSIQLRTYTKYGYTTSKTIHAHTLSNTTVVVVTCCLLWSLFALAASTFALLYYRLIEGEYCFVIIKNKNKVMKM